VASQRLVTDAVLAAARPGAADNPTHGVWGWVRYYGTLCAFLERGELQVTGGREQAERTALAALARTPIPVEGIRTGGEIVTWQVHPKGLAAHEYIHEQDLLLAWLNGWTHRLHGEGPDSRIDARHALAERVAVERSQVMARLCWIATTPGPYLPFEPFETPQPVVPEAYRALDEFDVLRLIQAFARVNAGRGAALAELIAPPKDDGTPGHRGWSILYATLGQKLGVPVASLLRDYTLPELIAQAYLAAGAEREAFEAAQARHDATRGDDADDEGARA